MRLRSPPSAGHDAMVLELVLALVVVTESGIGDVQPAEGEVRAERNPWAGH